jgi:2-polyprenyl-6-methoxyphenol hydroxylase-like FAD-dependent oxidoreductase
MPKPKKALIAGAGIAELSAAIAFRRWGIESRLVEIRSALGFTESFDTAELKDAKALLDELN